MSNRRLKVVALETRTEWLEIRPGWSTEVATGSLACPECDAPVAAPPGRSGLGVPLACGYCGRAGAVRDFLSLEQPTRPAHVVLLARLPVP